MVWFKYRIFTFNQSVMFIWNMVQFVWELAILNDTQMGI